MRFRSRAGVAIACASVNGGRRFADAVNWPWTWQARMRSSIITGVRLASESSNPALTAATIDGRFGRGSSSQICDFIAKAWLLSCMIDEPSP